MKYRTKLKDRHLPNYTRGEEIMNMVTHIAGGSLGILALIWGIIRADGEALRLTGAIVFGVAMIALYAVSSVYHGLHPSTGKKVMQVLDHCTIYFLICGTYTPILLAGFIPRYPEIGWSLLGAEWGLAAIACTLTAIDLKKYNVFSMICYIAMGWGIIFFLPQARQVMSDAGLLWLLAGGIAYTLGAILYGIGSKIHWIHSVFHIFVVLGSLGHFVAIFRYVL